MRKSQIYFWSKVRKPNQRGYKLEKKLKELSSFLKKNNFISRKHVLNFFNYTCNQQQQQQQQSNKQQKLEQQQQQQQQQLQLVLFCSICQKTQQPMKLISDHHELLCKNIELKTFKNCFFQKT